MADLKDIYDFILKPGPQGGIYQPGPPVMMPPQGMGGQQRRSGVDPIGLGTNWNMVDDWVNDPATFSRPLIPPRLTAEQPYGPKRQPPVDTTYGTVRDVNPYTLGYGAPLQPTQPPAVAAIDRAMPPMPRPRPVTPGFPGPITQPDWNLPGMDTGMNGAFGPPTRNPPALPARPPTNVSAPLQRQVSLPGLPGGILDLLRGIPGKSQPTAYSQSPAGRDPEVHRRLMAQQRPNNPEAHAAQQAGRSYYIDRDGSMSPTRTITGAPRRL